MKWCGNHPINDDIKQDYNSFYENDNIKQNDEILFYKNLSYCVEAYSQFRNFTIFTTIKENSLQEFLISEIIKSKEIHAVSDGIYNNFKKTSRIKFSTNQHSFLTSIPNKFPIFCPKYLYSYAEKVGIPKILKNETLKSIKQTISSIPEVRKICNFFKEKKGLKNGIIISQHYYKSNLCSRKEEILYYISIINYLEGIGVSKIFWKSHPRDDLSKIDEIIFHSNSKLNIHNLDVTGLCPIEYLEDFRDTIVVGANSTALLEIDTLDNKPVEIISVCCEVLPLKVNQTIKRFAKENNINNLDLKSFKYDNKKLQEKYSCLLSEKKHRDLYIWGASEKSLDFLASLDANSFSFLGFIDSNVEKINTNYYGLHVSSPDIFFNKQFSKKPFIIIPIGFREEIYDMLKMLSFSYFDDFIFTY